VDETYFGYDTWRGFDEEKGFRAGGRLLMYLQETNHPRIHVTYNDGRMYGDR
jgi:hypothetical protein